MTKKRKDIKATGINEIAAAEREAVVGTGSTTDVAAKAAPLEIFDREDSERSELPNIQVSPYELARLAFELWKARRPDQHSWGPRDYFQQAYELLSQATTWLQSDSKYDAADFVRSAFHGAADIPRFSVAEIANRDLLKEGNPFFRRIGRSRVSQLLDEFKKDRKRARIGLREDFPGRGLDADELAQLRLWYSQKTKSDRARRSAQATEENRKRKKRRDQDKRTRLKKYKLSEEP